MLESSAPGVLLYLPLSLAVLVVVTLWFVALSDIGGRARGDAFTAGQLAYMAAAVSVAAMVAIVAASVVLLPDRTDIARAEPTVTECGGVRGTFIFSFGIEQPSYTSSDCAEDHTGDHPSGSRPDARTGMP